MLVKNSRFCNLDTYPEPRTRASRRSSLSGMIVVVVYGRWSSRKDGEVRDGSEGTRGMNLGIFFIRYIIMKMI